MSEQQPAVTFVPIRSLTLDTGVVTVSHTYADGTDFGDPITAELADGRVAIVYPGTEFTTVSFGNIVTRTDSYLAIAGAEDGATGSVTRFPDTTPLAVAALETGGFVLVTEAPTGFETLLFDANGAASPGGFTASTDSDDLSGVTRLTSGSYVASWTDGDLSNTDVFGQVIAPDGVAHTSGFRLNTTTASFQFDPNVAALPDGGFVAVWVSRDQDGDEEGVFLQRFDPNGDRIGAETQVNTITAGGQDEPEIEVLQDGSWIVGWRADFLSETRLVQHFAADGSRLGTAVELPDPVASSLTFAALPDGGFVAVSPTRENDVAEVTLRRFGSDVTPIGEPLTVRIADETFITGPQVGTWSGDGLAFSYATVLPGASTTTHSSVVDFFGINSETTGEITLTGTPRQGETLSADVSALQDPNGLGVFSFQWLRDGVTIDGATEQTYAIKQVDVDTQISVSVSHEDGLGIVETVTSDATAPVIGGIVWVGTPLDDVRYGGLYDDRLSGLGGDDDLRGRGGNDVIKGGDGADLVIGRVGDDRLFGNADDDEVRGGDGNDLIKGGDGADLVIGRAGDDRLFGNADDDLVRGGDGNDELSGGKGRDFLNGGHGDDTLKGGPGRDIFVFRRLSGEDRIVDFDPQKDRIDLPERFDFSLRQVGLDVELELEGQVLTIDGVALTDLDPPGIFI